MKVPLRGERCDNGIVAVFAQLRVDTIREHTRRGLEHARPGARWRSLRDRYPRTPILVLSMMDHPVEVRAALSAGANGYLLKESAAEDLIQAMRSVATPAGIAITLTEREREVLQLVVLDHTNKQMAQMLGISMRTVEAHRASLHIVGVKSRAELIRFALDAGLVRLA